MGIVKEKPEHLKPVNDLDNVDINPDTGLSVDAYLSFGGTPKAITNPPKQDDVVTYLVKVECVGETHRRRSDGEVRYVRHLNIISAWKPGETEPVTDDDQGELFDEDGNPTDDGDADGPAAA
jgi:hypothetical protein